MLSALHIASQLIIRRLKIILSLSGTATAMDQERVQIEQLREIIKEKVSIQSLLKKL